MRVGMYYNNNDVRVEEMPKPEIGLDEILVKAAACGICGSDVLEWYRIKKAPIVLGHEMAGEIVEVGENVKKYTKGQRVFVSHHIPCNTCSYCLNGYHTACDTLHSTNFFPGGFSEYIRIPALNVDRGVFPLPDEMSYDQAVFIEPLACVVRAQRLVRIRPGQSVVVMGSGISGLLHIMLAKTLGAGRIIATDINEDRLKTAKELGAEVISIAVNPDGYNINDKCGATHTEMLSEKVIQHKADLGIALDGDADRVIFCDASGKEVNGDRIIGLCALDYFERNRLENNSVVITVMTNLGLIKRFEEEDLLY